MIRARHPRRPLASFLGLAPVSHSPLPLHLPTDHCPLITAHHSFKPFRCNTYAPPRKCCKQKTYTLAKPFKCNTYGNHGGRDAMASHWSYHHTGTLFRLISFICHSYENTGGVGVFFPFWNSSAERSQQGLACSEISTFNRRSRLRRDCGLWTESSV